MMSKKKSGSLSQIKAGAALSYLAVAINIIAGLLYTPWMVRQIGQSHYGLYTLAISLISLLMMDFGIGAAVARFVSKYRVAGDQQRIDGLLGIVYKLYLFIDAVFFVALIVVYLNMDMIYGKLTPTELAQFKLVYLIAAGYNILSFPFVPLNGILTAYEEFVPLKLCDIFHKLLSVALIVLALSLGWGLFALVAMNSLSGLTVILIKLGFIRRKLPVKAHFRYQDKAMTKEIFGFSAWTTVISVSQRFIFNITPTFLGMLSGSASIALFGAATTIEGYTYTIANAVNGLLLPRVTRILAHAQSSKAEISRLMIKVGRIQLMLIGGIFVGFVCVGRQFMLLWMGAEYEAAYYYAVALLFPSVLELPQHIAANVVIAQNEVKRQAKVYLIMAGINITLMWILIHALGGVGAAVSICIAYVARTLMMDYVYHRHLQIDIRHFLIQCYKDMILPILLTIVAGLSFNHWLSPSGWGGLVMNALWVLCLYAALVALLAVSKQERALCKKALMNLLPGKKKGTENIGGNGTP